MIMGLHLIKTEWTGRHACVLNVDNQAALVAIRTDLNKPGQHLAEEVLKMTKQIKKKRGNNGNKLTFRWLAGHVGIKGNEDTDKEERQQQTETTLTKKTSCHTSESNLSSASQQQNRCTTAE
jgi:hypothetical protein